ncbi:MAG: TlpA family protein disulfide reductase [Betaproteobacteria bacterium]|nr:TlpA family protein disulfide reductase [Betaproteobacteria bacterium]
MNGTRIVLAAGTLAVALCAYATAEAPTIASLLKPLKLTAYRPGTVPPDFTGQTLDARAVSMSGLRGRVVLVNFWASWCAECRPEMPVLDRLYRELAPKGLVVLGINAREDTQAVKRYASELNLRFPLVLDPAGAINQLYGVVGIPATFLVARDGRAVAFAIGPRDWGGADARALLEALLAEPSVREGWPL